MFEMYSRYNPPRIQGKVFTLPSMTQQHFKDECDVNNILKRYVETGILENIGPGVYTDLMEAGDYRQAIHTIMNADEAFKLLPSNIRKEFGNDPAAFMEFIHDPDNKERGIELGLFNEEITRTHLEAKRAAEMEFTEFKNTQKTNQKSSKPSEPAAG